MNEEKRYRNNTSNKGLKVLVFVAIVFFILLLISYTSYHKLLASKKEA
jgi:hypothetical protein